MLDLIFARYLLLQAVCVRGAAADLIRHELFVLQGRRADALLELRGRKSRYSQVLYRMRRAVRTTMPVVRRRESAPRQILLPMLDSNHAARCRRANCTAVRRFDC